jgi:hypothetical protein
MPLTTNGLQSSDRRRYRSRLFVPGLAASTPQLLTHLHHRLMPKSCDQEHLPEVKGLS